MISRLVGAAGAGRLGLQAAGRGGSGSVWPRSRWAGGGAARPVRSYGAGARWPHAARRPLSVGPPGPVSQCWRATTVSGRARNTAHTPPPLRPDFPGPLINLEAPSINTRSGMPGAHSTRQPHRREGAGAGAEEPHHEVSPGLWLWPWRLRPLPPGDRPPAAAAAAAPAAAAAGGGHPAARRRLLGGDRAGGGGGAAGGAARLRAAGAAAAHPGVPAAGGGGYAAARGLAPSPGAAAPASGRGATKPLSPSLPRCARSLPSARTAWKYSSRTTSTSPRWQRKTDVCSPALTRQGTTLLSVLTSNTGGNFCLLQNTLEADLKICASSSWLRPGTDLCALYKHHPLTCTVRTVLWLRHFWAVSNFLTFLSFQDKCLKKISSGLYTFQTYLEYIQETFTSEKQNVESLCYSTQHLAHTIRQMVSWF